MRTYVVALVLAAGLILPGTAALADDAGSQSSAGVVSRIVALPRAAAGVLYGVSIGVPVRAGKYIHSESHRMVETLLDDLGGPGFFNLTMARAIAYPYGITSGTILGLVRGVQYGAEYGVTEPFSQKSIGLE